MDGKELAALLRAQDRILILTHKRPDGDTTGCAAGLCLALRQLGKQAWVLPNEDITPIFAPYLEGLLLPAETEPAFVVSVDIAGRSLFTPAGQVWLERGIDLAIDHHPSYEGFAKESWVEPGRAACGELILELAQALGPMTPEIATPLYVAIATDTGCFAYSNTTPATHRAAALLMETGIDTATLNKRHFRTKSWKRIQLECSLLQELELHDGGRVALAAISLALMDRLSATSADLEDVASLVGQVEGVETAVTIKEQRDGSCKLSVRTSGGLNANKVCALLGGGGHAAASGCMITGSIETAKNTILEAIHTVQAQE